jgi:hypothetical protein
MTPDRYLAQYRPGLAPNRPIESLPDFLEAIAQGADLWNGGRESTVTWRTMNSSSDYQALKALGWDASSDYGSYDCDWMYVHSPHKDTGP